MDRNFTVTDEGKRVLLADGTLIGTIDEADGPTAHVVPDESLSPTTEDRLGWRDSDPESYSLSHAKVATVDDRAVHLKRSM